MRAPHCVPESKGTSPDDCQETPGRTNRGSRHAARRPRRESSGLVEPVSQMTRTPRSARRPTPGARQPLDRESVRGPGPVACPDLPHGPPGRTRSDVPVGGISPDAPSQPRSPVACPTPPHRLPGEGRSNYRRFATPDHQPLTTLVGEESVARSLLGHNRDAESPGRYQRSRVRRRSSSSTRRIVSSTRGSGCRSSASIMRTRSPGEATEGRTPRPRRSRLARTRISS